MKIFVDEEWSKAVKLIFNCEATQYITSNDLHANGVCVSRHNTVITSESNGTMAIAVKMFRCHNAAGYCTKTVFVIADDEMGEEELKMVLVRGLGNNNVNRSNGWLCCTNACMHYGFIPWVCNRNYLQICETISRFSASNANLTNLTIMKEMKIYWMI